jgi:hypothetical protein
MTASVSEGRLNRIFPETLVFTNEGAVHVYFESFSGPIWLNNRVRLRSVFPENVAMPQNGADNCPVISRSSGSSSIMPRKYRVQFSVLAVTKSLNLDSSLNSVRTAPPGSARIAPSASEVVKRAPLSIKEAD